MLVVITLVALVLPSTIAAYRRWGARPTVPVSRMLMISIPLIIDEEEEDRLGPRRVQLYRGSSHADRGLGEGVPGTESHDN